MSMKELEGRVIVEIRDLVKDADCVLFICADGSEFKMYHQQDCCETVDIDDIEGDVEDLLNSPVVLSEEINDEQIALHNLMVGNDFSKKEEDADSFTWTYYRIQTLKGMVVIRWFGQSSGYYSESVYFEMVKKPKQEP